MKIIISLASYPARYNTLHLCLQSLFSQTFYADEIILYIPTEKNSLPESVLKFEKQGLNICKVSEDLRPHNKYYYAMQEYKDDIIITVDDDAIYPSNLIELLVISYLKFPFAVSAGRAHGILLGINGYPIEYTQWDWEAKQYDKPLFRLMATGVGGILYPPHCMNKELFRKKNIRKFCLLQDDVWLKCMQLLAGTPVIIIKQNQQHPLGIPNVCTDGLYINNKYKGGTNKAFQLLIDEYKINLREVLRRDEYIQL